MSDETRWGAALFAWSPTGERLATTTPTGEIILWDAQHWQEQRRLAVRPSSAPNADPNGQTVPGRPLAWSRIPTHVTWSADGAYIAAVASDTTVRLWDAATGAELWSLDSRQDGWSNTLSWSPDSRYLAIDRGRRIQIWDVSQIDVADRHDDVTSQAATDGYESFATHETAATLVQTIEIGCNAVESVWSPTAPQLAVINSRNGRELRLYQPLTGQLIRTLSVVWSSGVVWAPDGQRLACGCGKSAIQVWAVYPPPIAAQAPGGVQ